MTARPTLRSDGVARKLTESFTPVAVQFTASYYLSHKANLRTKPSYTHCAVLRDSINYHAWILLRVFTQKRAYTQTV